MWSPASVGVLDDNEKALSENGVSEGVDGSTRTLLGRSQRPPLVPNCGAVEIVGTISRVATRGEPLTSKKPGLWHR